MRFLRSDSPGPESSRWRLAHRALLGGCGIPPEVANSDRRWVCVLLHGEDESGTGWDASWVISESSGRIACGSDA